LNFYWKIFNGLMGVITASFVSHAAFGEGESHTLAIVVSETDSRDFSVMAASVETQLSDIGVAVRLVRAPLTATSTDDLGRLAKSVSRRERSPMVVLVNTETMGIYLDEGRTENFVRRPFPGEAKWEDTCDAAASVARSVLEYWLNEEEAPEGRFEAAGGETGEEPEKEPEEPTQEIKPPPPPKPALASQQSTGGFSWGTGVNVGYVLQVASSQYAVLNGAHFGLGLRLTRFFRFDVGLDVLQRMKWENDGWQFSFRRLPVRTIVSGQWMSKWLAIGASTGLVVDITKMDATAPPAREEEEEDRPRRDDFPDDDYYYDYYYPDPGGLPPPDAMAASAPNDEFTPRPRRRFDEASRRTFLGLYAGGYLAFRVVRWLDIRVSGGVDLYFNHHVYRLSDGKQVLDHRMAQPRVFAGLTFWFLDH
jgi:hypothetical protein